MKRLGQDVVDADQAAAVRLPNRVSKGLTIDKTTGTAMQSNERDVVMSPSNYLTGQQSPRAMNF